MSMVTNTASSESVKSLASLPVGTGLPDAVSGKSITVFGSTGFVARYFFDYLGRKGPTFNAALRGDDMEWRRLRPLCPLGKLTASYFNLGDEDSIRAAIQGSDVVLNLAGKYYETKHYFPTMINWSFEDMHVKGYERLARIAREENVKHFVHLSSVTTNSEEKDIDCQWTLTKKRGETAIKTQFPGATIVKSNVIFGEEDMLLNWYAAQMISFGVCPMFGGGAARVRPVYVGDVAKALATISTDYSFCDETVELHGPHEYTYKEIVEYVAATAERRVTLFDFPEKYEEYFGKYQEIFPKPKWTRDMIKRLKQDQLETNSDVLTFKDLGMKPFELEKKGFNTLYKYKRAVNLESSKAKKVEHS